MSRQLLGAFILILTLAPLFSPLILAQPQIDLGWARLVIPDPYVWRGDSISFMPVSNSSYVRVMVGDLSNNLVFDQVRAANQSITLPTGSVNPGIYFITIGTHDLNLTKQITVLDADLSTRSPKFPISRTMPGLAVNITAEGKVFVNEYEPQYWNASDEVYMPYMDLRFLANMIREYDADVSVYESENVHIINATKGSYFLEVSFYYGHEGVKWGARWLFPEPQVFRFDLPRELIRRKALDIIELGNINVNLDKVRDIFTDLGNGTYTAMIPASGEFDPLISAYGFEDGLKLSYFDSETSSGGAVCAVNSTGAIYGDYGAYFYLPENSASADIYLTKNAGGGSSTPTYVKWDTWFNESLIYGGAGDLTLSLSSSYGYQLRIDGMDIHLYYHDSNNASYMGYYDTGYNIAYETPTTFEIGYHPENGAGLDYIEFYADGVLQYNLTNIDLYSFTWFTLGCVNNWRSTYGGGMSTIIKIDNVKMADEFIGDTRYGYDGWEDGVLDDAYDDGGLTWATGVLGTGTPDTMTVDTDYFTEGTKGVNVTLEGDTNGESTYIRDQDLWNAPELWFAWWVRFDVRGNTNSYLAQFLNIRNTNFNGTGWTDDCKFGYYYNGTGWEYRASVRNTGGMPNYDFSSNEVPILNNSWVYHRVHANPAKGYVVFYANNTVLHNQTDYISTHRIGDYYFGAAYGGWVGAVGYPTYIYFDEFEVSDSPINYTAPAGTNYTAFERTASALIDFSINAARDMVYHRPGSVSLDLTGSGSRALAYLRDLSLYLNFTVNTAYDMPQFFTRSISVLLDLSINAGWDAPTAFNRTVNVGIVFTTRIASGLLDLLIRVLTTRGIPINGAGVLMFSGAGYVNQSGFTNSTGYIEFSALPEGNYTVQAYKADYQPHLNSYDLKYSQILNIELVGIEEGLGFVGEVMIIAAIALVCTIGAFSPIGLIQATLSAFMGFLFWLGTAWVWVLVGNSLTIPIATLFIAPALICLVLAVMGYIKNLDPELKRELF